MVTNGSNLTFLDTNVTGESGGSSDSWLNRVALFKI